MVAQLCEDGEEALTCVKVERTGFKGKLKKSGSNGSTSSYRQYTVLFAVLRVMMDRPKLGYAS